MCFLLGQEWLKKQKSMDSQNKILIAFYLKCVQVSLVLVLQKFSFLICDWCVEFLIHLICGGQSHLVQSDPAAFQWVRPP